MSIHKGKGLTPEQYEKFIQNENSFNNDFSSYIKTLTNNRDIEFAQLKRKYQSSFEDQGDFVGIFTHKFTNSDEFHESLSKLIKKSGNINLKVRVSEDFEENGCDVCILSEINQEYKELLEIEMKSLSIKYKSLFKAMKYFDSHIQTISGNLVTMVQDAKALERKLQFEKILKLSRAAKEKYEIISEVPKTEHLENNDLRTHEEENKDKSILEEKNEKTEENEKKENNEGNNEENNENQENQVKKLLNTETNNICVSKDTIKIYAKQLTFRSLGSSILTSFKIELVCSRCEYRNLSFTTLDEAKLETGDYLFKNSLVCNCTLSLFYEITPLMIFPKSGKKLAVGKFENCAPIDLIDLSFKFTCPQCGDEIKLISAHSYSPFIISCQVCFASGTFQIDGFDFLTSQETTEHKKKDKNIFIGKPLPKNGVCKHFKNSFRWFKFPCCQRLFPCMTCHDDNTDHPSQRSELYVCGFCGHLEKISNRNVCKECGGSVNGLDGDKKFWEGGKGCRNTEKMSKKDKKRHFFKK